MGRRGAPSSIVVTDEEEYRRSGIRERKTRSKREGGLMEKSTMLP